MFSRIRRAPYSTGVTQEFLQGILLRAQEATAKKAAPVVKSRKGNGKRYQEKNGASNRRRSPQQQYTGSVTPRVKPTFNHSIINRQPQFKKKDAKSISPSAAEEDLIDAFESTSNIDRRKPRVGSPTRRNGPIKKKEVAGLTKRGNSNKTVLAPPTRKRQIQEAYTPQEPTLASLMKFYPALPNTSASRLINYSLGLMKTADFPLYRNANYGLLEKLNEPAENVTFSLRTPTFGQYTEAMPLTFEKEKMFKNLTVEADPSSFDSVVLGRYPVLSPLEAKNFKSIAKDELKRKELATNSNIVRQSLQGLAISTDRKQAVYEVCSGLSPVAGLTQ